jgi:predicted kinase
MANHTRELLLMIGESGSGKSTIARALVADKGYVRVNRDDLRVELEPVLKDSAFRAALQAEPAIVEAGVFVPKNFKNGHGGRDFEDFVSKVERARAAFALAQDLNVVVDNTHLNPNTVDKWRHFANHKAAFRIYRVETSMDECIRRDAERTGKAHVGRAVIERQFLKSGRHPAFQKLNSETKVYLYDIDGTTANHCDENGRSLRSPYGLNVEVDRPYPAIIHELQDVYTQSNVLMFAVSGRKSTCGDATWAWLDTYEVPRDGLFMRHSFDNSSDVPVKQEILREILAYVPKEQIVWVADDRPRVVRGCWMEAGIPVRTVFGGKFLTPEEFTTTHRDGCAYLDRENYRRCPDCGALEDF